MKANDLADVLARFADAVNNVVDELRDNAGDDADAPVARVGREVKAKETGFSEDDIFEVRNGDLWRLVNRARKMIRLAREGKVPSQNDRAPLCRSIKTLKNQGLVNKPDDLRDQD